MSVNPRQRAQATESLRDGVKGFLLIGLGAGIPAFLLTTIEPSTGLFSTVTQDLITITEIVLGSIVGWAISLVIVAIVRYISTGDEPRVHVEKMMSRPTPILPSPHHVPTASTRVRAISVAGTAATAKTERLRHTRAKVIHGY